MWKCLFCGKEHIIQMNVSECKTCNVSFFVVEDQVETWKWIYIHYSLKHPLYLSLTLRRDRSGEQSTKISFQSNSGMKKNKRGEEWPTIEFPAIFEIPKPQDALVLVKRLHNMKVFA
jgi:hypothetical protein